MPVKVKTRRITAVLRSGQKLTLPAWVLDTGRPGPHLLVTAAQHGNEVQGCEVIRRFVEIASTKAKQGQVFAVPFANLAAIRERRPHIRMKPEQAYSDDRGHNMNRTWPGNRNGNDTARLSYAIYQAFGEQATHAFDFHCWEKHAAPGLLIRDVPGLRGLAQKVGHRFVIVCPPSDHTLGGHFCSEGRIGVTYEFSGQYVVNEKEVKRGLRVLMNFAKGIGLLPGALQKGDDPVLFSDQTKPVEVKAPCSGLFVETNQELCAPVKKGALIGHILSDVSLARRKIVSPVDGYLRAYGASRPKCDVALPGHHPYVSKGDRLATIVKSTK